MHSCKRLLGCHWTKLSAVLSALVLQCNRWWCRYKQGRHPVYGAYYMKWWFVHRQSLKVRYGHYWLNIFARTPLIVQYMRMLGAKIGDGVYIDGMNIGDGISMHEPDLVSVGEGTIFNNQATVLTHTVCDGYISFGGVMVGSYCQVPACLILLPCADVRYQVGCRTLMMLGSVMGNRVTLCEHSVLQQDQVTTLLHCVVYTEVTTLLHCVLYTEVTTVLRRYCVI